MFLIPFLTYRPPELLCEAQAVVHAPVHLPLQPVEGDHHIQPARSPAVEQLSMFLPSKTRKMMTSALVVGNKEEE